MTKDLKAAFSRQMFADLLQENSEEKQLFIHKFKKNKIIIITKNMSEIKNKTITTRTRDYKLIDPQKNKKKYKNKISIKKKTKNVKDNPININKIPFGLKNNHKLNYNKLDINEKDLNSSISSRNKNNITSIDHSLYPVNQKINIKDFYILLQLKLNKNNNKKTKKNLKNQINPQIKTTIFFNHI